MAMGAATENNKIQDPLGLQTFALSESAYDMVCTLRGTYGRLCYSERQKNNPNRSQIDEWRWASNMVLDEYQNLNWNDFGIVEKFIERCVTQWHSLELAEKSQPIPATYVHQC